MKKGIISIMLVLTIVISSVVCMPSSAAQVALKGIDVSYWNGQVNWSTAKRAGLDFAILRCYSWGKDSTFDYNYQNARANGIAVGAYIYMYAESRDEAIKEATETVEVLRGKPLDYPLFLDVEDSLLVPYAKGTLTDWILLELSIFANAGIKCAYYTFTNFKNNYIDNSRLSNYDLWLAQWPYTGKTYNDFSDISPSSAPACQIWQFADNGSGSKYGCSSEFVDMNYSFKDYKSGDKPEVKPSGNVLKVTYNSTGGSTGYKYLDKSSVMIYPGYKLVYDVYLENSLSGIGGIELDDKYGCYARDSWEFVDQNGISGSPASDISQYAYKKWYHREISLPSSWNGTGYANFYSMIAYHGTFQGNAVAYFDNIRIVDGNGNDAEYFFENGGSEFSYLNNTDTYRGTDYSNTNFNGLNAEVIDISKIGKSGNVTVNVMLNDSPWTNVSKSFTIRNSNTIIYPDQSSDGKFLFTASPGGYYVYDGEENTYVLVDTTLESTTVDVKYYTLNTDICPSPYTEVLAYLNGRQLSNGQPILEGTQITVMVTCSFDKGDFFFKWSNGFEGNFVSWTAGTPMPTVTVECVLFGDIDKDNQITSIDALLVFQHSIQKRTIEDKYFYISDVDCDGNITSFDALLILQKSVKIIYVFPVEN